MPMLSKPCPDQPETAGVHSVLATTLHRRFGIIPQDPRTPHDPCCMFNVGEDWCTIYIIPERDTTAYTRLRSHGRFPWTGRWNLRLEMPGGERHIYRPRSDQVRNAADKIMIKVNAFLKQRKVTIGPVKLRLVVDNTQKKENSNASHR